MLVQHCTLCNLVLLLVSVFKAPLYMISSPEKLTYFLENQWLDVFISYWKREQYDKLLLYEIFLNCLGTQAAYAIFYNIEF